MSYYIGIPLIFFVALVEASVLPLFRVAGLQPNLMLVLLVCWLMVRGANEALVLIPFAGIFLGFTDAAPMGTALLALSPIAILDDIRGAHLREGVLIQTIVFTVLMTLTYHLVYMFLYLLQGASGDWLSAFIRVAVPSCLLNVVLLLPVYMLMWASSHELRRASYV